MSRNPASITRIDAVLRTVPDLVSAEHFYRTALDFRPEGAIDEAPPSDLALLDWTGGRVRRRTMRLGAQRLEFLAFDPPGPAYPQASSASDLWFQHCAIVVSDMDRAYEQVIAAGARPITQGGPQHLPANTGGVAAFKFRDPFGHPLELLAFPEGVGDPIWHGTDGALFRAIDHTAITVSSSAESRRFYETLLGMREADHSHNRGPAQSRLDAVPDDSVDVTALMPVEAPPHLELLGYRTGTRRSLAGRNPADMAVSRTLATGHLGMIESRLAADGVGPAELYRGTWFGRTAIAFHDPDGHGWICRAAEAGLPA